MDEMPDSMPLPPWAPEDEILSTLITANHILHLHNVLDAYGHISVRNPADPSTFLLSKDLPPALVSNRADIQAYNISDASAVDPDAPQGYAERFIHSEIYKRYADVNAVMHSHNEAVLPFTISSMPLRPVFHMAGVMGYQAPIFDIASHYTKSDSTHSMLVNKEHLGAALAAGFSPASMTSRMINLITSSTPEPTTWPPNTNVLMRGHGFTCIGGSIEEAVFRAVFTCKNAHIQTSALALQQTRNLRSIAARFGAVDKNAGAADNDEVRFLSERECKDAWSTMQATIQRPWKLWCAEVANCGLYRNEIVVKP